jgi:eukaryotic-like serine/threonine-protein kinase
LAQSSIPPRASLPCDLETFDDVPLSGLSGRYQLIRRVGAGASSWVFAARDLRLEREVAVKILKPVDAGSARQQEARERRILAEGRTLARLAHPHIVTAYDAGETAAGFVYLVMELSEAGNLEDELASSGPLSLDAALSLILPLIGALACAHDRGIIHRDIKPANIALVRHAGGLRAKLLDFGIAKEEGLVTSRDAVGTPAYMAPEQARGEAVSAATDVWGVGVLFFRCLTGALPFPAANAVGVLQRVAHERAPCFQRALPSLPRNLGMALDRALEPDPRDRYPDMRAFAQALACACRQEGIPLPEQPEPLGLPEFASWLSAADTQPTKRSAPARLRELSALRRAALPALSALTALVGLGALAAIDTSAAKRDPSVRVSEVAQRSTSLARSSAGAAPAVQPEPAAVCSASGAVCTPVPGSSAEPAAVAPVQTPAPVRVERSGLRKSPRRASPRSHDTSARADEGASEIAAQQGFMTAWE